jgi:cytochrome c-type biogenesis protein CcmH
VSGRLRGAFPAGLAVCLLVIVGLWLALAAPDAAADELDDRVRRVAKQLRCPICESVSVADSPAELAVQMRGVIRARLEAGVSEEAILSYFGQAYGDTVFLEPPRRGLGWLVWLGPVAALVAGALLLWAVLRVWVRPKQEASQPPGSARNGVVAVPATHSEALTEEARRELEAVRRGAER